MNNINLPWDFLDNMKVLLKDEYDTFLASYESNRFAGLRRNLLKSEQKSFEENMPFSLTPVPWAEEGYYYDINERPGRHPLHDAGAYYIQEPSAMSAVAVLDPKPFERILDLCAAPGGKSTQIAGRMDGKGLLISNEIVKNRSEILSSNIERLGVKNAVVLNESPASLASRFQCFFDKILVDAPCSGEGMFKKEEAAALEWSNANVKMCHERQLSILEEAAKMLKPGGTLVFSTCTFNPTENEGTVSEFLHLHPEFTVCESSCERFFSQGHPEWTDNPVEKIEHCMRLWPHKINGEGHFVALLHKEGILSTNAPSLPPKAGKGAKNSSFSEKELFDFLVKEVGIDTALAEELTRKRNIVSFGENIYSLPDGISESDLKGLKVQRAGLCLAKSKKNRFEPAHSLALSLLPSQVASFADLSFEDAEKYLKGETISCDPSVKGWVLVCYKGFSMGWGKASGGIIKNHYPKGLRIMC